MLIVKLSGLASVAKPMSLLFLNQEIHKRDSQEVDPLVINAQLQIIFPDFD